MNLDEWIKQVQERCDGATPGPWEAKFVFGSPDLPVSVEAGEIEICAVQEFYTEENNPTPNFSFIAHSRADLPKALRIIERMRETLKRYESNHALIPSHCGPAGTLGTADLVPVYGWAKRAIEDCDRIAEE